ncbi:hypothetical protein Dform_00473 [Dehalogenimonas formicexedens]|uniref:Uncharacterized protein n=2 Tax=Dehalogenimonas TaxID=670486 RepID=A0A1P8F5W8_9CHLR|nr:hypothetical protein [Dehalogenimonas formicexedens]APV43828.1 hypothetical protein Dform_00473 [Dehalogenimonas formicexedens]KTB49270.1 hypothetical protein DEALK_01820 [Dehalogenimonas alkenigignens]
MPKKYSAEDRARWLKLIEEGKTESKIVNDTKADPRTVRDGIIQARRERDLREANVSLIRDALKRHQEQLLAELTETARSVEVPAVELAVVSWYEREPLSVFLDEERLKEKFLAGRFPKAALNKPSPIKQHLGQIKLTRFLSKWQKEYQAHLLARIDLQLKTLELIRNKTGLPVVSETKGIHPPFVFSHTACAELYKYALRRRFSGEPGKTDAELKNGMVVDRERHLVTLFGKQLAEVDAEGEDKCRSGLLAAYEELTKTVELKEVETTYKSLGEWVTPIRELISEYSAIGMLPGTCSICERIGT